MEPRAPVFAQDARFTGARNWIGLSCRPRSPARAGEAEVRSRPRRGALAAIHQRHVNAFRCWFAAGVITLFIKFHHPRASAARSRLAPAPITKTSGTAVCPGAPFDSPSSEVPAAILRFDDALGSSFTCESRGYQLRFCVSVVRGFRKLSRGIGSWIRN